MAQEFTLNDLIPYLDLFEELGLDNWIDGSWGVDALLGEQTRSHKDLYFLAEKASSGRLVTAIRERGFIDVHTNDHTPWNFVMGTPNGTNFDFHVLKRAADGDYTYGAPEYPIPVKATSIDCTGTIAGRSVRWSTPEFQIDSHTAYTIKETDIHDVSLLSKKFGPPLHPEQLEYLTEHPRN